MTEFILMKNAMDAVYRALDPAERADDEQRQQDDMEEADRKDHKKREEQ